MRLEPVFVVAPKATSSISTRRAFLFASGTFAVGATLGGACGYAMGSRPADAAPTEAPPKEGPPKEPVVDEPLTPSGDADLDELRRLAVKAPIQELVQHRLVFVSTMFETYPKDRVLWQGVKRLCDYLLAGHAMDNKNHFARGLAGVIEQGDPDLTRDLRKLVPSLKEIK